MPTVSSPTSLPDLPPDLVEPLRLLTSEPSWFYGHKDALAMCSGKELPVILARADILRRLDARGFIEARFWSAVTKRWHWQCPWCSVSGSKGTYGDGGWPGVLAIYRTQPQQALEIRISELGRAALDEFEASQQVWKAKPGEKQFPPGTMSAMNNDWRDRIVDCVHEDSRDDRKAQRYRAMIREWADGLVRNARQATIPARERLRHEHPDWTDEQITQELQRFDVTLPNGRRLRGEDARDILYDPIAITTHAGTPLNKKYATLAAIHDASKHCHFPLKPWAGKHFGWGALFGPWADGSPGPESVPPDEYREARMALAYARLMHVASELTEDARPGVERILDEVAADLEQYLNDKDSGTIPGTAMPRTRPTNTHRKGRKTTNGANSFDGYAPADTIWHDHGIKPQRLSEAKRAGKIRWMPAPTGFKDTDGRPVRVLYNVEDVLKHCQPKHVQEKTRRQPFRKS